MSPSLIPAAQDLRADAESFASALQISPQDREKIIRCLSEFPAECKSRGMFFEGVLENVRQRYGDARAKEVVSKAGIQYRIQNFGQYPHRDFYKVFYLSANVLHPTQPIATGLGRIAEDFYPLMFAKSLAGKTMALLMGDDPATVLARFVDAYGIAATWNEHRFERGTNGVHHWRCRVEPCEFYPNTFQGICRGMVRSVTKVEPDFRVVEQQKKPGEHRYVFEIRT